MVTEEVKKFALPVFRAQRGSLREFLRRYDFLAGLVLVTTATLADGAEVTVHWGRWLKAHHGPDFVIAAIFFFSGIALEKETLVHGLLDFKAFVGALVLIFVVAPLWAHTLVQWPMDPGLAVGLFLVACMPSTLSSGVVMTQSPGGNAATALLITIVANAAAVLATPLLLQALAAGAGNFSAVALDKSALMGTLAMLVLFPLGLGTALRRHLSGVFHKSKCPSPGTLNTILVIFVVWIAVCGSRTTIVHSVGWMPQILALCIVFHSGLLLAAFAFTRMFNLQPGRLEAVIFMGGQKTLPLSVLLQTALFPQYGQALVLCLCHHVIHLIMDGFVLSYVNKLRRPNVDGK